VDVAGAVEAADEPGQISTPRQTHARKRLGKKALDPMLKARAVAHWRLDWQEKGVHLQPANLLSGTQQPFFL
jgi:hypothetical protein